MLSRALATALILAISLPPGLAFADERPPVAPADGAAAARATPAETEGSPDPQQVEELEATVNAMPAGEDEPIASSEENRAAYESSYVTIDPAASGVRGFLGTGRQELSGAELYLALDRPDLASRYRVRQAARWALLGTSAAAMGVGAYMILTASPGACPESLSPSDLRACRQDAEDSTASGKTTGTIVMGLALVAFASTWIGIPSDPVTRGHAKRLAWKRNRDLRRRLGVFDLPAADSSAQIGLVPHVSAGEFGLNLVGSF